MIAQNIFIEIFCKHPKPSRIQKESAPHILTPNTLSEPWLKYSVRRFIAIQIIYLFLFGKNESVSVFIYFIFHCLEHYPENSRSATKKKKIIK